jgi:hypothetical protein
MDEPGRHNQVDPYAVVGHEQSDAAIRPLAIFLAVLAISLVIVSGIVAWLFHVFEISAERSDPRPSPLADADQPTPGPLLQVSPRHDLDVLRKRDEELLEKAEWIDRETSIARIPIEEAIKLTAERGLPKWPAAEVGAATADDESNRAPTQPAARTPAGTGQQTPIGGGQDQ